MSGPKNYIDTSDWLSPELRNVTDKFNILRRTIGENHPDEIGYMEDGVWKTNLNEANSDYNIVNEWLNDTLQNETYPSKAILLTANKLWRKYNR